MEKYNHIQRSTLLELLGHVNNNTFTTHEATQIILDIIDKNYDLKKESKSLTGIEDNFKEDMLNSLDMGEEQYDRYVASLEQ